VLKKRKVEAHGDFILSSVSPKEYKDTVAELNGSRTNRVFEFFNINPLNASDFLNIVRQPKRKLRRLLPPKRALRRRRPRRAPLQRKPAGGRPCRGHCYCRREGPEETQRAAGGLAPITQEDSGHRRGDRPR
jgi:hypothetical protein